MKSNSKHTPKRKPTTATNSRRRDSIAATPSMIADRSMLWEAFRKELGSYMLAGPALWRWRKFALFPR